MTKTGYTTYSEHFPMSASVAIVKTLALSPIPENKIKIINSTLHNAIIR